MIKNNQKHRRRLWRRPNGSVFLLSLYHKYPGVLRTDRRAGWFLCGGMSDRLRNLWIEWVKITKKIMFPVQHSDREEISWMQTVRCRVVPCRVVPCRAVPCHACVHACVHSETVFWRWCTGYQEEMIIIRCDSQKDFSEHGTTAWLAQNKKCVYRTQRNSFLKLEDV